VTYLDIPISEIKGSVYQPRHQESRYMRNLYESILRSGLLNPITVRADSGGYYLICGHRRVEILSQILRDGVAGQLPPGNARPVNDDILLSAMLLHGISDADAAFHAFVDNEEREDLTPLDRACFYNDMVGIHSMTEADIASRLGIKKWKVNNKITLLRSIPHELLDAWKSYHIGWSHVKIIMTLETKAKQLKLLQTVLENRHSSVETEMLVWRMRDTIPGEEKLFFDMEQHLYTKQKFVDYIDNEKIKFRKSRNGKWYNLEIDSPKEMRTILLNLADMLEDFEGID